MERIGDTIKRLYNHPGLRARYEKMKAEILNDPHVRAFLAEQRGNLTHDAVEKGLMTLYEYSQQSDNCTACQSLEGCKNLIKGYVPRLTVRGNTIHIQYAPCRKKIVEDEKRKKESLIKSLHVPREIVTVTFNDIDLDDPGKLDAMEFAAEFVEKYQPGKRQKGLYLYGDFGVGKTFCLGAIGNQFSEKVGARRFGVYRELVTEGKGSMGDSTWNEEIEWTKKQPVLMIDDIGAETMSSWTRDEVLGPVLQFRMQEHLPTFFTSNFSYDELEHHLTYSQRGETEKVKARRIMERIKYLTVPIRISGANRRLGSH